MEEPGCCHCRYDGGEGEKGKKEEAINALECRRSAGVLRAKLRGYGKG